MKEWTVAEQRRSSDQVKETIVLLCINGFCGGSGDDDDSSRGKAQ